MPHPVWVCDVRVWLSSEEVVMDVWDRADAANDQRWIDDRLHEEQLRRETEMTEKTVTVVLSGCDDETEVEVPVTGAEFEFLNRLSGIVNAASEYQCQPKLLVGDRSE
jgi:hypothetical protein